MDGRNKYNTDNPTNDSTMSDENTTGQKGGQAYSGENTDLEDTMDEDINSDTGMGTDDSL